MERPAQAREFQEVPAVEAFSREMLCILRDRRLQRVTDAEIQSLSLDQAYEVQMRVLDARAATGERIAGWKVGCTSPAIQQQFGLSQPISGRILEPHIYASGCVIQADMCPDCAVEAEMVFRIGRDLSPNLDLHEIRDCIDSVHAGIEFHRYRFWYGEPTSQELIASNGIHAGIVVGEPFGPEHLDMDGEIMHLLVNGEVQATGAGREVQGGPLQSLQWLARHAAGRGQLVRAGELVIPGSAVKLVRVFPGDAIEARFETIGTCFARLA